MLRISTIRTVLLIILVVLLTRTGFYIVQASDAGVFLATSISGKSDNYQLNGSFGTQRSVPLPAPARVSTPPAASAVRPSAPSAPSATAESNSSPSNEMGAFLDYLRSDFLPSLEGVKIEINSSPKEIEPQLKPSADQELVFDWTTELLYMILLILLVLLIILNIVIIELYYRKKKDARAIAGRVVKRIRFHR